jgi:hypothetical protein
MSAFHLVRTVAAAIAIFSLAGCAASGSSAVVKPTPTSSAAATSEPTATPSAPTTKPSAAPSSDAEPPEVQGPEPLEPGDVINWEDLERLSSTSYAYYHMRDNSLVVTDPARPFPTTVTADIQARIDAIGPDDPSDNGTSAIVNFESERALHAIVENAGKEIVTVRLRRMAVPNEDGTSGGFRWVASGSQSGWWMQWERERDVMVGNVRTWIDANAADDSWIVAVGPGEAVVPNR